MQAGVYSGFDILNDRLKLYALLLRSQGWYSVMAPSLRHSLSISKEDSPSPERLWGLKSLIRTISSPQPSSLPSPPQWIRLSVSLVTHEMMMSPLSCTLLTVRCTHREVRSPIVLTIIWQRYASYFFFSKAFLLNAHRLVGTHSLPLFLFSDSNVMFLDTLIQQTCISVTKMNNFQGDLIVTSATTKSLLHIHTQTMGLYRHY